MGQYSQYATKNLTYTWNATSVDAENNKFFLELKFDDPRAISASSYPDYLEVNFNYQDFFKNPKGAVLITKSAVKIIPSIWDGNLNPIKSLVNSA